MLTKDFTVWSRVSLVTMTDIISLVVGTRLIVAVDESTNIVVCKCKYKEPMSTGYDHNLEMSRLGA